eukprot:6275134-Pyramimonas_sp.AAC.1
MLAWELYRWALSRISLRLLVLRLSLSLSGGRLDLKVGMAFATRSIGAACFCQQWENGRLV